MVWSNFQIWLFMCVLCVVPVKRCLTSTLDRQNIYNIKYMDVAGQNAKAVAALTMLKHKFPPEKLSISEFEPGFKLSDEQMRRHKLWPEGIIPYYIDDFSYDKVLRDRIRVFLDVVGSSTGLHFRELPSPPDDNKTRWVFFVNRQGLIGCSDHTPAKMTNEGVQRVVLGYNCMSQEGELSEAVLAIVGVPPQHNSPDRDEYITVETSNILPGVLIILAGLENGPLFTDKVDLFKKLQNNEWLFHDLQYDFTSAGHFNFHKHTKDGLATITPKKPIDLPVGENDGLSFTDILKIRMLYNYITRQTIKTIKGPECDKLFKPGRNFSQFEPEEVEEVKPRSLPAKYLGRPDESPNEQEELLQEKLNLEDEKAPQEEGGGEAKEDLADDDEDLIQKTPLKGKKDINLSDYDTAETNRQLQNLLKKPKRPKRRY